MLTIYLRNNKRFSEKERALLCSKFSIIFSVIEMYSVCMCVDAPNWKEREDSMKTLSQPEESKIQRIFVLCMGIVRVSEWASVCVYCLYL